MPVEEQVAKVYSIINGPFADHLPTDEKPGRVAAYLSEQIIRLAPELNFDIDPSYCGSIVLSLVSDGRSANLECYETDLILACISIQREPQIWEVNSDSTSILEAITKIKKALKL